MIWVGIDHGAKGALSALDDKGNILSMLRMPLKNGAIDCFKIHSWLYEHDKEAIVYGEQLGAIFGSASKATFSFGKSIGKVVGVIECLQLSYHEVKARDWQAFIWKEYKIPEMEMQKKNTKGKWILRRDTKGMAQVAVDQIWGSSTSQHDGINDSLLIAAYALHNHTTP